MPKPIKQQIVSLRRTRTNRIHGERVAWIELELRVSGYLWRRKTSSRWSDVCSYHWAWRWWLRSFSSPLFGQRKLLQQGALSPLSRVQPIRVRRREDEVYNTERTPLSINMFFVVWTTGQVLPDELNFARDDLFSLNNASSKRRETILWEEWEA